MVDSVLVRVLGDSVNLRILSFFIENPFESYTVSQISEFAGVSRNSAYNYLPLFLEKAHIIQEKKGSRDVYRLNQTSRIVDLLDKFVDMVGDINLQPQIERTGARNTIKITTEKICVKQVHIVSSAA